MAKEQSTSRSSSITSFPIFNSTDRASAPDTANVPGTPAISCCSSSRSTIGFRLLFGDANSTHVGRGLTYLFPIVEPGLFADPLRFRGEFGEMTPEEYKQACSGYTHIAFEQPEAHLHPKVQTRLAHWMVALAMANRQLIVETHSDHLVRRLRGLMV